VAAYGGRARRPRAGRLAASASSPGLRRDCPLLTRRAVGRVPRGGILQDSGYNEVWTEARNTALTPAQYRSPLGQRPYDLRHAAVSLWLNSGVPATEVARPAGHGVAVLLKIYAHCIDGQADTANQRITDAPGIPEPEPEPGPGDQGDDDSEQAS
jgi:integrase